jgi:hypothetical protein
MPITLEQLFDKISEELILDDLGFVTSGVVKSNQKTIRNGSFKLGRTGDDKLALYQKDIEANKEDLAYLESDGGVGESQLSILENLAQQIRDVDTIEIAASPAEGDDFIVVISGPDIEVTDISFISQTGNNNPLNVSQFIPIENQETLVDVDNAERFLDTNIFELLPSGDARQARIIRFFQELNALLPPEAPEFDLDEDGMVDRNEEGEWEGAKQYSLNNSISEAQENEFSTIDEEEAFIHRLKSTANSVNDTRTIEDIYNTILPYLTDLLEPIAGPEDGRPEYQNQSSGYLKFRNLNQGIVIRNTNQEFIDGLDPDNPTWLISSDGGMGTGFTITMWVRFLDRVSQGTLFNYGNPTRNQTNFNFNGNVDDGFGFKLETYVINKNDFTGRPGSGENTFGNFQENTDFKSPYTGMNPFENTDTARFVRLVVNGMDNDGNLGFLRDSTIGTPSQVKFTWNMPDLDFQPGTSDGGTTNQSDELAAYTGATHIPEDFDEWYFICASYNPNVIEPARDDVYPIGVYDETQLEGQDYYYGYDDRFWLNHIDPFNGEQTSFSGYGSQCKVEAISRTDLLRARGFKV